MKKKYIRRIRGKKSRRRFKKRRFVKKRFTRLLNSVAEKKSFYFTCPNSSDTHDHTLSNNNTVELEGIFAHMYANLAQGTARNERVGAKIFIRNIVIKGVFYSNVGTDGATGKVGFWLGREKTSDTLVGRTRQSLIGTLPDALIPDFAVVGYQWIRKKTGWVTYFALQMVNNTPMYNGNSMGYEFNFKIKIRLFKSMEFQSSSYKISDGKYDLVPIPFIDTGVYNKVNNGIQNSINVRVTYTDV